MRITLTIEDDRARPLLDLARETNQPFDDGLNAALPGGLGQQLAAGPAFNYVAHPGKLRSGIDGRRLNELLWEADDSRFTSKA